MICIIVAYDQNRVIGKDGQIPWHLPDDLKRFQMVTMGHNVIMGRRTWDSIPLRYQPLPGRTNIVLTRERRSVDQPGVFWVGDLDEALATAQDRFKDTFIIGGESVYKQALDKGVVEYVIASEVEGEYEGDTYFPELTGEWDHEVVEQFERFKVVEYRKCG